MSKKAAVVILMVLLAGIALNYKNILKFFYPIHYENLVTKYSRDYKLDPRLVYSLIKAESKFNPYAKSGKGALGLMQITPQTGKYISNLIGDKEFQNKMLFTPEINIKYGCFYLSKLYKDFNGNIEMVLAAYNGGEGNVRKWLREDKNGKKYLDIEDIPFYETKGYVIKVNKSYRIYKFLYQDNNNYY